MNLTTEVTLHGVARALRERIAPALTDDFAAEAARLAQVLLTIAANAVDDAAALRIEENAALRGLFGEAAALVEGPLNAELAEASRSRDPGFRVRELDRENGRLRNLLVVLHAAVEVRTDEAARLLDRRIWRLLGDIEAKRGPRDQPAGQ